MDEWIAVMAGEQDYVNRPLFYATQLLSIEQGGQVKFSQSEQYALYASVNLLLSQALLAWLQEFSSYINVSLEGWSSLLDSPAMDLPESQYFLAFRDNPKSWLSLLLERVEADSNGIIHLRSFSKSQNNASLSSKHIDLIAVDSLDDTESEQEILSRIIVEFKQYMQSVRSRQVEW